MTRIILLAHDGLASALRRTAIGIVGPCSQLIAVDLNANDSPSRFLDHIRELILKDGECDTILVLTDLFGGTPWRLARTLVQDARMLDRLSIVGGMNLAMVLEACSLITVDIDLVALTEQVLQAATDGIRA